MILVTPPPILAPDPAPGTHLDATLDPAPYTITIVRHGRKWRCTVKVGQPCRFHKVNR